MSTRSEQPAQRQLAPPMDHTSAAFVPSTPRHHSLHLTSAGSALSECVGAISLIEVTMHSLESQEIACPEQDVLNRALKVLWSVHDWMYDRSWPDNEGELGSDRGCQS